MQSRGFQESIAAIFLWVSATLFAVHISMLRIAPATLRYDLSLDYHMELEQVAQLVSYYVCAYLVVMFFSGQIIAVLGRSMTLLASVLLNECAVVYFHFSNQIISVIIVQVLFGISGACALNIALSSVKSLPDKYKLVLNPLTMSATTIGFFVGSWPLMALVDRFSWRLAIFVLFSMMNVVAGLFCLRHLLYKKGVSGANNHRPSPISVSDSVNDSVYFEWSMWAPSLYGFFQNLPTLCFATVWLMPFSNVLYAKHSMYTDLSVTALFLSMLVAKFVHPRLILVFENKKRYLCVVSVLGVVSSGLIIYAPNLPGILFLLLLCVLGSCLASWVITTTFVQTYFPAHQVSKALAINLFLKSLGGLTALVVIDEALKIERHVFHMQILQSFHYTFILIPLSFWIAMMFAMFLPTQITRDESV